MKTLCLLPFLAFFSLLKPCYAQTDDQSMHLAIDVLVEKARQRIDNSPDTAFIYCKQALKLAEEVEYLEGIAEIHQLLGEVYSIQGAYSQSLSNYLEAIDFYTESDDQMAIADCYHKLGQLYYYSKQDLLAFESQYKALEIYLSNDDSTGIAQIYGSLGHLFEKNVNYDSALYYQNRALHIYEKLADFTGLAIILENIGSIYEDLEDFDKAFDYFSKSQEYNEMMGNESAQIGTLNNLGDIYRKTNDYVNGLSHTQRSLILAEKLNQKYKVSSSLRDMAKTYVLLGNYDSAYRYLNRSMDLYEDIYTYESARQITLLQTLFEIEQKNDEIKLLEQSKRIDQLSKTAIIFAILMLLLIGGILFSRQRLKIRKNKELLKQKEKSHQVENQLMHAEIKSKSKELTSHMLHAIAKNQILEQLKKDVQSILDDEHSRNRKEMKSIIRKIDTNFQRDEEWERFSQIFTKVHESFFDSLSKGYPDLTTGEKRLASLIKLNISSRDIATILAISPDSLRISRYRLRKKLGLDRNVQLEAFVQNL